MPRADSYSAGSGAALHAGRNGPANALATSIAGMASGAWLDWSASTNVRAITDVSGPNGYATAWLETAANYALTGWPGKGTWDSARHQVLVVGTAQGYTSDVPAGTHASAVYMDTHTGLFSKQWNPYNENIGHIYDSNCSIPMGGKIYRKSYNGSNLYQCELTTRVWSLAKAVGALALSQVCQADVFPDLGASGSVIFVSDNGKLSRWDIATDALSTIGTYSGIGIYPSIHYVPVSQAVIFGGGSTSTTFYKLDNTGAVTTVSAAYPSGITGTGAGVNITLVADPSGRAKSWMFVVGGNVFSLDHTSGTWTDHGTGASCDGAAVSCHGLGAVVFLKGSGRVNASLSYSAVHIFKVI